MKTKFFYTLAIVTIALAFFTCKANAARQLTFSLDNIEYQVCTDSPEAVSVKGYTSPKSGTFGKLTISDKVVFENQEYAVEEISELALHGLKAESLTLPSSLLRIKRAALSNMDLQNRSITLPENIESMEYGVFRGTLLDHVEMSERYKKQPYFFAYSLIRAIDLSESLTKIDNNGFEGCVMLEKITLPKSITEIGSQAFTDCWSLTGIDIPEGVVSIGKEAFKQNYDYNTAFSILYPNFYGPDITEYITPPYVWTPEITLKTGTWPLTSDLQPVNFNRFKAISLPGSLKTLGESALLIPSLTTVSFLGKLPHLRDFQIDVQDSKMQQEWTDIALGVQSDDIDMIYASIAPFFENRQRVKVEIDPALGVDEVRWVMTDATDDLSTAILRNGMTLLLPQDATVRFLLPDNDNPFEVAVDGKPVFDSTGTASVKFSGRDNTTLQFRPSGTGIGMTAADAAPATLYRLDGTPVNEETPAPGIYVRISSAGAEKVMVR